MPKLPSQDGPAVSIFQRSDCETFLCHDNGFTSTSRNAILPQQPERRKTIDEDNAPVQSAQKAIQNAIPNWFKRKPDPRHRIYAMRHRRPLAVLLLMPAG